MAEDIYQEQLLLHAKNPSNFNLKDSCKPFSERTNPLCGDRVIVGVSVNTSTINDACFSGTGCAVMLASASIMTEIAKGRSPQDISSWFSSLKELMYQKNRAESLPTELDLFASLQEYPARHRCVLLPWEALSSLFSN